MLDGAVHEGRALQDVRRWLTNILAPEDEAELARRDLEAALAYAFAADPVPSKLSPVSERPQATLRREITPLGVTDLTPGEPESPW